MIGVDTNVLIRLLTADDRKQYDAALRFFETRSAQDPAFVSIVTLAETIWVLQRNYKLSADEIIESLSSLLDSDDFVIEAADELRTLRTGGVPAQLATDLLIAQLGLKANCSYTVTFDRKAARGIASMELLT